MAVPSIPAETRIDQINAKDNCTFIRWVGEFKNARTRAVCRCDNGHEWTAAATNLISNGQGCKKCAATGPKITEAAQLEKLAPIAAGRYTFTRIGEYLGSNKTRYAYTCLVCGHSGDANLCHLLIGRGCSACGKAEGDKKLTKPREERVAQLEAAATSGGYKVLAIHGDGNVNKVRVECSCLECGKEWSTPASGLIKGTGCPTCSPCGYTPSEPGSLYVLVSHCGLAVKVGISNKPDQRLKRLTKVTPFSWHQVAQVDSQDGAQIARWEKEIHSRHERAFDHSDFDGATEWLKTDRLHEILDDVTRMTAEAA
ncbi:hypothetical protein Ahp2_13 [Aeromonas phage Ahp2]|nr:hypothetical protein Ahp2_13 [Aeromonas phage Ahp2]